MRKNKNYKLSRNQVIVKLLALFTLAATLAGIFVYLFSPNRSNAAEMGSDYLSYITGASLVRENQGNKIYDLATQSAYQKEILALRDKEGVLPFKSPPFVAILFLPLTFFSFLTGYKVFAIFNLTLLALLTFLFAKTFPEVRKLSFWFLVPFLYLSSMQTIIAGQISFVTTLIVLALLVFLNSKRVFAAGIVSSLLILKPQYVIAIPFFLLLSKKRKSFMTGFALALMFLILISIAVSGLPALLGYPSYLLSTENPTYGSHLQDMFTLNSTLLSIPDVERLGYGYSLLINGIFYLAALYLFMRRYTKVSYTQSFISATILFLVFAVHVQSHDLSVLLVPVFLLLHTAVLEKERGKNLILLLALSLFLLPNIIRYISPIAGTLVSLVLAVSFLYLDPKMFSPAFSIKERSANGSS
ncbi:DUF2029 domain-containing protein [Patescibacteria group bacterium]|nr:DUF2029 domain-containing protein [Patescibacteria group bacterium]